MYFAKTDNSFGWVSMNYKKCLLLSSFGPNNKRSLFSRSQEGSNYFLYSSCYPVGVALEPRIFFSFELACSVTYIDVLRLVGRRRSGQFISTINSSFGVI